MKGAPSRAPAGSDPARARPPAPADRYGRRDRSRNERQGHRQGPSPPARRDRTGLLDQLVKPSQDAVDIAKTVGQLRSPETGQVSCDDTVGPDQLRDHPHPHGRELPLQQHDRWAVTAFQHGGGHPGQLQPSLGDGQPRQQALAGVLTDGTSSVFLNFVLAGHAALLNCVWDRPRGSGGVGARPEARAAGHKRDGARRERTQGRLAERRSGPSLRVSVPAEPASVCGSRTCRRAAGSS